MQLQTVFNFFLKIFILIHWELFGEFTHLSENFSLRIYTETVKMNEHISSKIDIQY